jgi:hypothetical protein
MAQYRVLQGIDYPPNKRAEAGDIVTDLAPSSIKWLLEVGAIEDVNKKKTQVEEPVAVVEPIVEEPVVEEPVEETPVIVVSEPDGFNPDAKDGDGDGFVQDGTPFQRPVEETE